MTNVNDMNSYGGWSDLETYKRAWKTDRMILRMYSFVPLATWERMDSFVQKNGRGDDLLHWGGLKGYVDGSLGSTTAWFHQPYLDDPGTNGLFITDTSLLRKWVLGISHKQQTIRQGNRRRNRKINRCHLKVVVRQDHL